ncbi:Krr1-domain-containing protein [Paraphaeosphaeria sporulosa]|uniref:Krr1-domain-containing protein n=1 Tax=Paraphaeosphaeria sporulosa TaxID=1460663 RepID=A0A177CTS0_9PLEO|nr:Krr1-domain-containing protein [Paraphaeosphaeria sporulosa]OAG10923.1 Krr1-domain-containing protein [Paraphaeosphaeria sporulosa]
MGRPRSKQPTNGVKRELPDDAETLKTHFAKKTKLLDDSDDEADGAVSLKINEDYARRFEHNKKREEQHRLEEKYGKGRALQDAGEESEDSQEGVEEDDAGELVTEDLDQEISATLAALRSKDPRIYDSKVKFFTAAEEAAANATNAADKGSSMTLRQYHTKNLLEGNLGDEEDTPRPTYAQEQEEARQELVKELEAAEDNDEEDDFLVAKSRSEPAPVPEKRVKITVADVENADKDPETFLSNFMASRAWVPKGDARFQPLESDESEEDAAAEEYEHSYNMYFEDTTGANEKLVTYARDAVAKTTVRRDGKSSRAKAREAARAKREAERKEKEQDLARLRKLKMDEMEHKVQKIRQTGGLKGRDFNIDEWKDVLEAEWSDDQWDKEMQRRFGDAYYQDNDAMSESDDDEDDEAGKRKKKTKKPKFDDDLDIKDLIPDFKDNDEEKPEFTLTDDEDAEGGADDMDIDDEDEEEDSTSKKSSKQRKQERADAKSAARRDRRLIENLVNDSLQYETALAASSSKAPKGFRYRETSPTTFGMTPRDILLASDKQLNEFAGLKKLAAFRDPAKKKKDKKLLSKKARLRQWRQETFGDGDGPKGGFETILKDDEGEVNGNGVSRAEAGGGNIHEGERKKKRKRKGKKSMVES